MVANAPIIFKVELQGLTAQLTMEAELVATTPTIKGGGGILLQHDVGAGLR